jgi:hypothetical protein
MEGMGGVIDLTLMGEGGEVVADVVFDVPMVDPIQAN